MIHLPTTMAMPFEIDDQGVIVIVGTQITLEMVIARYKQGMQPRAIQESFESLSLTAIYAVIAYYLAHQPELDRYLAQREAAIQAIRQKWETQYPPILTRADFETRLRNETEEE